MQNSTVGEILVTNNEKCDRNLKMPQNSEGNILETEYGIKRFKK